MYEFAILALFNVNMKTLKNYLQLVCLTAFYINNTYNFYSLFSLLYSMQLTDENLVKYISFKILMDVFIFSFGHPS